MRVNEPEPTLERPAEPRPAARPRPVLADDLPTLEPRDARRSEALPAAPDLSVMAAEEDEPSETVVHVNIGRIDVRAIPPAPAPAARPSRSSGPRLSLGDYLKGRGERRR